MGGNGRTCKVNAVETANGDNRGDGHGSTGHKGVLAVGFVTRLGQVLLTAVGMVLAGCSSGPPAPSDAQLKQELSGPPNLRRMRDKLSGKATPPGGKRANEAATTVGSAPSGAATTGATTTGTAPADTTK